MISTVNSLTPSGLRMSPGGLSYTLPSLNYARPRYQNVESILKYIEQDNDKGGVKLVIMNFIDQGNCEVIPPRACIVS